MAARLSICIPTLDRAHVLDAVLASLTTAVEGFPVEICVSDNASTDGTEGVLAKWRERLPELKVTRQQGRVSYDGNVSAAIGLASAHHIWMIPDYAHVSREVVRRVLAVLDEAPQHAIFMNVAGRVNQREDLLLRSPGDAFREFGWHVTLAGSFIIFREAYRDIGVRFAGSAFIHFEACFEALATCVAPVRITWLGQDGWCADPAKTITWGAKVVTLWMSGWRAACLSLPEIYSHADKLFTVREHHRRSGVFKLTSLLLFRSKGGCSLGELWRVRDCWRDTGLRYVMRATLVACVPRRALVWMYSMRGRSV